LFDSAGLTKWSN